jgi:hypothetical protein
MDQRYVVWGLRLALGGFFAVHAGLKFFGYSADVELFDRIGLGQGFRHVTALAEATAAALILGQRTVALGALQIMATMAGAILTRITVLHSGFALEALIALVAAWLAWRYRFQILSLLP